jgi:hypothetical protein
MSQKQFTGGDLPEEAVLDVFSTNYDRQVDEGIDPGDEDIGLAKDSGVKLVKLHHTEVAPRVQPILVEAEVQFAVNDVPYSGIIDAVDDRRRVRDWKTTAKRPNPSQYLLNMIGYALGYRQLSGETESEVVLDYLVRTKTPKYVPVVSGGPVSDESIVAFSNTVSDVAQGVASGSFPPNGVVNGACSWCGYRNICPAVNGGKGVVE